MSSGNKNNNTTTNNNKDDDGSNLFAEISHYVVTAHPPGCVLSTTKCNFVSPQSVDVLIAKSGRLEVRQLRSSSSSSSTTTSSSNNDDDHEMKKENMKEATTTTTTTTTTTADLVNPFPLLFQVPMYGRIIHMIPFSLYHSQTSLVFFLTDRHQYGVIGYDNTYNNNHNNNHHHQQQQQHNLYPIVTHASGSVTASSLWSQGGNTITTTTSSSSGTTGVGGGDSSSTTGVGNGTGHSNGSGGGTSGGGATTAAVAGGTGNNNNHNNGTTGSNWMNENTLAVLGREAEAGSIVISDPLCRCIIMHLHSGLLTIVPIQRQYKPTTTTTTRKKMASTTTTTTRSTSSCLGHLFHCRIEEQYVLAMTILQFPSYNKHHQQQQQEILPHICILHQDARGVQHVSTHVLNIQKRQLYLLQSMALAQEGTAEWLRKTAVDGGSAMILSVPPPPPTTLSSSPVATAAATAAATTTTTTISTIPTTTSTTTSGGVIVIGQRQFTYCSSTTTKIVPVPQALYLCATDLPPDPNNGTPRFLLSDEFGNLHMLTLLLTNPTTTNNNNNNNTTTTTSSSSLVLGLQLETLGSCNLSRDISYLGYGLVYVASHLGDSQLIQIHDEPIPVVQHSQDIGTTTTTTTAGGNHHHVTTTVATTSGSRRSINAMEEDKSNNNDDDDENDIMIENDKKITGDTAAAATTTTTGISTGNNNNMTAGTLLDTDMDVLADTTYIQIVEEYTNLGPILDFDLIPTAPPTTNASSTAATAAATTSTTTTTTTLDGKPTAVATAATTTTTTTGGIVVDTTSSTTGSTATAAAMITNQSSSSSHQTIHQQSQVVTCSGTSKMGSLRLIRNGIGMNEYASVEIPGISNMWSLRQLYNDVNDTYLVQSFVGQTRVLGVTLTQGDDDDDDDDNNNDNDDKHGNKDDNNEDNDNVMTLEEEEEQFGSLEEVVLPGLESNASTLYVGNLQNDRILQITETEIRLLGPFADGGEILDIWSNGPITVATANEAGQIALAQRGGKVLYFQVMSKRLQQIAEREMEREVSCLNLNPFQKRIGQGITNENDMDVDGMDDKEGEEGNAISAPLSSRWLAVGLWDDFTVRLLDLDCRPNMEQVQLIHLSSQSEGEEEDNGGEDSELLPGAPPGRRNRNNMMARSLCLITLDFSSNNNNNTSINNLQNNHNKTTTGTTSGVDMLFVGLGDGSLISFAVLLTQDGQVTVRSKKEVCLGTQRIDLIPLSTRGGGNCVLATGDRPTVIYLAGIGGGVSSSSSAHFNPKLCYSSVNLSASEDDEMDDSVSRPPPTHQSIAVNVASSFYSPLLFDSTTPAASSGSTTSAISQRYSLCVADESSLRLGVIDDIQKLHVTTCRLGMAPRRIVHCSDGRLFAVGCLESGIKHYGAAEAINSMGNCIRFMDDTNFDDIKRVDLDPFETLLCMAYVSLSVPDRGNTGKDHHSMDNSMLFQQKPFLVVGTGYSMADESEITRGRVLVFSCGSDENAAAGNSRTVRQVTELSTNGGVFSVCQFYDGTMLCAVNSKTMICRLYDDAGLTNLQFVGVGHHGHILSMFLKSGAKPLHLTNGVHAASGTTGSGTHHMHLDSGKPRGEISKKR